MPPVLKSMCLQKSTLHQKRLKACWQSGMATERKSRRADCVYSPNFPPSNSPCPENWIVATVHKEVDSSAGYFDRQYSLFCMTAQCPNTRPHVVTPTLAILCPGSLVTKPQQWSLPLSQEQRRRLRAQQGVSRMTTPATSFSWPPSLYGPDIL